MVDFCAYSGFGPRAFFEMENPANPRRAKKAQKAISRDGGLCTRRRLVQARPEWGGAFEEIAARMRGCCAFRETCFRPNTILCSNAVLRIWSSQRCAVRGGQSKLGAAQNATNSGSRGKDDTVLQRFTLSAPDDHRAGLESISRQRLRPLLTVLTGSLSPNKKTENIEGKLVMRVLCPDTVKSYRAVKNKLTARNNAFPA